jgi:hypothetical protein
MPIREAGWFLVPVVEFQIAVSYGVEENEKKMMISTEDLLEEMCALRVTTRNMRSTMAVLM